MKLNGFTYTKDADGDWRGVSDDGRSRTRLKGTRDAAIKDVNGNRLQHRRGDVWVDTIDGPNNRYTVPVEAVQQPQAPPVEVRPVEIDPIDRVPVGDTEEERQLVLI